MRRRHAVLVGLALPLVAPASAASAAEVTIGVDDTNVSLPTWTPPEVAIAPGDTVVWNLDSPVQLHDVAAATNPGTAAWSFEAKPPEKQGRQTFTTPGRYVFVCRFHSGDGPTGKTGMVGTVVVGDAPPPPPPPPGMQPFPNDSPEPSPLETGGLDTTKPSLRSVRVRRNGRGARISFRVSERATVVARFLRGGKVVKTKRRSASGSGSLKVRGLRAGRYRVELRAEDVAGNRSGRRSAHLELR